MNHSLGHWKLVWALAVVLALVSTFASAQGASSTSSLSGLVVDSSGGVIPGADVVVKNNATATEYRATSDSAGRFTIPSINPGIYTVKVSLMGFKTWSSPDVSVTMAPAGIKATLEVGSLEETVVVRGVTELVQTQTAAVQTTLVVQQIQQLPVITHTALDYVVSLPGVDTPGSATRSSTLNGLPGSAINITLDGVNVQDQRSHEGFFMYIRPMMDSVEEITVSTSTPGAESSGQGASSIRMVTRSGSNQFTGAAYNTWRNQAGTNPDDFMTRKEKRGFLWRLNTPYWFNRAPSAYAQSKTAAGETYINDVRLTTPGFRVGGPIWKDKAFFFFNSEWFLLPESRSRLYRVMNDTARAGTFTFSDGTKLNLLTYMANKGVTGSTPDPTISKLLADIAQASSTEGTLSYYDQNTNSYSYVPTATQKRIFPTLRLDYNLSAAHRLTFNGRYNSFNSQPDFLNSADARFPGFPNQGGQVSGRYMLQGSLRSTFGKNMVNEVRVGDADATGKGTYFGYGVTAEQFNCSGLGCQSVGGLGWSLGIDAFRSITTASAYNGKSASVAAIRSVEDTFTWLKGSHTVSAGGSWSRFDGRSWNYTPTYSSLGFGVSTLDPAYNFLTTTALKAAGYSSVDDTWSGYARSLYAVLTGRVNSFGGTAYLGDDGKYHFNGERSGGSYGDDWGFFLSDAWRIKPNLTLTAGVRYELQLPYKTEFLYSRPETWQMVYGITGAGSGSIGQGNLFKGGTVQAGTATPVLVPYETSRPAYNTDWNNLAPSVGVTWRPNVGQGFLSRILSSDPVFRGGYSLSYTRLGTNFFDSNYASNPGRTRAANRTDTVGTPLLGQDTVGGPQVFPVLLRDTSRLFPSQFPDTPTYPITPAINETLDIHYPDWPIPKTHQYSFGWQREFGKSMAMEIRYVGNTNVGGWTTWNMTSTSQWSMLKGENGFYDEFRLAQQNLHANIVAGKGNTFAYTGAAGTSPLPIFMAYLQGIPLNDARNQATANYTASQFKSSSWLNALSMYNPYLTGTSSSLGITNGIAGTGSTGLQYGIGTCAGNASAAACRGFDANRIKAGLPTNFFIANPAVAQGNAYLETTGGNTRYNAVQLELRRRISKGLLIQSSYQYSFGRKTWSQRSLREDWFYIDSTGGPVHSFKANWVYQLPFGRGRSFASGVGPWLDRLIGGWEVDGIARVQSGSIFNFGGYRLVGMTEKDLQKMFKVRYETGTDGYLRVYMLPKDVIEQSIIALSKQTATTATGYVNDIVPTGRYLAPASGPDCVQFNVGGSQPMCPGTTQVRKITGPKYWKVDMSFVKQIGVVKSMRIEARMDLFNVFDTINFTAVGVGGSSLSSWEITSAAADASASQDPGGRITQFGLRFIW